ncbi:hypothetical protein AAY473_037184 [Plecturocebus cupreus]
MENVFGFRHDFGFAARASPLSFPVFPATEETAYECSASVRTGSASWQTSVLSRQRLAVLMESETFLKLGLKSSGENICKVSDCFLSFDNDCGTVDIIKYFSKHFSFEIVQLQDGLALLPRAECCWSAAQGGGAVMAHYSIELLGSSDPSTSALVHPPTVAGITGMHDNVLLVMLTVSRKELALESGLEKMPSKEKAEPSCESLGHSTPNVHNNN